MDQYEFMVLEMLPSQDDIMRRLAELGLEGWHNPNRLWGDYRYVLQRKIPPLPPKKERDNENPCLIN